MKIFNGKKIIFCVSIVITLFACSKDDFTNNNSNNNNTTTNAAVALEVMNFAFGTDPAQKLDLYLPANRTDTGTKLLVLIHGGSWMFGDKTDMNNLIFQLKNVLGNYAIATLNYRLGVPPSTNLWPTQYVDIKAAFDSLNSKSSYFHYNTSKTAVYGESAGSQLGMLKAYKDNADGKIKTMINVFGPNDMRDLYYFYNGNNTLQPLLQAFLAGTPTTNPSSYQSASPIDFVTNNTPPTLSIHGSADATVPVRQSITLDSLLKTKNVVSQLQLYQGEGHGLINTTNQTDAFNKAVAFLIANNK